MEGGGGLLPKEAVGPACCPVDLRSLTPDSVWHAINLVGSHSAMEIDIAWGAVAWDRPQSVAGGWPGFLGGGDENWYRGH